MSIKIRTVALFTPLILLVNGASLPAQAQNFNVDEMYDSIQRSVCINDWDTAIQTVGFLMGSSSISPSYRQQLSHFRQQLETYRSSRMHLDMSHQPECAAAIAAANSVSSPDSTRDRRLDWDRAIASIARRSTPQTANQTVLQTPQTASQTALQTAQATDGGNCNRAPISDRRVSSGSLSSRWNYEIFEENGSYQARYWSQDDCQWAFLTHWHDSQRAAWREMVCIADDTRGLCREPEE